MLRANGTKRRVERSGGRLVCVGYRYDPEERRRITTVELVEVESEWTPAAAIYLVEIGWHETALRERAMSLGERWDPKRRLRWMRPVRTLQGNPASAGGLRRSRFPRIDVDIWRSWEAPKGRCGKMTFNTELANWNE